MLNEVAEDEAVENQLAENIQPKFPFGMVLQTVALIVDRAGVAWWVDPQRQLIRMVEV